jgi:lysophospholipase L1-like esterase
MKSHPLLFLFILNCLLMTQASASPTPTTPATRSLIIIGASYAAGLQEPALPGFRITNKGVGGEESHVVLARFARDVVAAKPDAVLVWGHINDIFRAAPGKMEQVKQGACQNFRAMREQARAAGIEMIIATEVTLTVEDGFFASLRSAIGKLRGREHYHVTINRHVREVNECLRRYAAAEKLQLVDLEKAVDSGNGTRRAEYSRDDGSHISPAGYAAIAAYLKTQLR